MSSSERSRYFEIDWIKAVGILVVVAIHSLRPSWERGSSALEVELGEWTRFAVPGFLAASGYLYATRAAVPLGRSLQRLRRILIPYLLFSVAAQVFVQWRGMPRPTGSVWGDLALASSFGPFYYVWIAVLLVAAAPLIARLPSSGLGLGLLLGLALLAQGGFEVFSRLHLFYHLRNPLLWFAYFLVGWLFGLRRGPHGEGEAPEGGLRAASGADWGAGWGAALSSLALAGTVALRAASENPTLDRLATWLGIYASLALLFVIGHKLGRSDNAAAQPLKRAVSWLSGATYTVYLVHLFFVYSLQSLLPPAAGSAGLGAIAATWALSVAASLAFVAAAQALLGRHSRTWIGA